MINGEPEAADWISVRRTKINNARDNQGGSDGSSPDMRCLQGSPGESTATVAAGDTLGFVASSGVMHFGPCLFYMARVPEGQDINTWEAAANVWFKAGSIGTVDTGGKLSCNEATWPAYRTAPLLSPKNPLIIPSLRISRRIEEKTNGLEI